MKVYVENGDIPKRCKECRFCYYSEDEYCHCCRINGVDIENKKCWRETHPDCPLLSISDYTKQVRKEVLDQVYKVFTTEDVWSELKSWWLKSGTCEELKACLDAMVEEKSVENIVNKFGHHRYFYQMLDQIQGETECQKN